MKLTRLGAGVALLAALALITAASANNNLLYLLFGVLAAALIVSLIAGRANLRGLAASVEPGVALLRGAPGRLRLRARNRGRQTSYAVYLNAQDGAVEPMVLAAGAETVVELGCRPAHRGLNRFEGLFWESSFPFGLIAHSRPVEGLLAWAHPRPREVCCAAQVRADVVPGGRPVARKGTGDELYGIRDYDPSDECRLINWKLTAKAGRPLVNEFCAFQEEKVTVRLPGAGSGEEAERRIEEAAAACRFYIDSGTQVRLVTGEGEVDYGRGLLHLDKIFDALARLGEGKTPRPSPCGGGSCAARDAGRLVDLTFAAVLLVYAAAFLVDEISPWLLAAAAPALAAGWWLRPRGGLRFAPGVWDLLLAAVIGFVVFAGWRVLGVTAANCYLLLYLIVYRALGGIRAENLGETFLILFLMFFLISGLTISLWYFIFLLAYLALAAAWLMLAAGLTWRARRAWAGAWTALLLGVFSVGGVCFAVTPRVEGLQRIIPFGMEGLDKLSGRGSAVSGFTENVSLGFFGRLRKSSVRIMRVELLPVPGRSPRVRPPALLIRGAAFDFFDGRRWRKAPGDFRYGYEQRFYSSNAGRGWARLQFGRLYFPVAVEPGAVAGYDFMIYPMGLSVLFTVGAPWMVEGARNAAFFDQNDTIHLVRPYFGGIHYKLYSGPSSIGLARPLPGREAHFRARFLQLPPGLGARVRELARRITARAPDDFSKARAVEAYLRRHYFYSTYSSVRDRTLEDFLFSAKSGNCEYFATAGVVLLRAVGVPARLATGFLCEDFNESGRFFDVRQSDAHAWMEVYLPRRGWLSLDPTPASGLAASAQAFSDQVAELFAAAQTQWYRWVIGYDEYIQRDAFRRLRLALAGEDWLLWARRLLAALLLAGGLAWLGRKAGKLWRLWRAAVPAGFYGRAQAALARAGLPRAPHQTPREYARQVVALKPALCAIGPLAELHYLERYGPGLEPEDAARARRLWRELRARL